jgi:predicted lipoprotein with Yx(FWY)xxD motif
VATTASDSRKPANWGLNRRAIAIGAPIALFLAGVSLPFVLGLEADAQPAGEYGAPPQSVVSGATAELKVAERGELGAVLTDAEGRTLYWCITDVPGSGRSVINGEDAEFWPPLTSETDISPVVEGLPGEVAVITREDGTRQVTYNGRPLYYFARERQAGDTRGHGRNDIWFVARP